MRSPGWLRWLLLLLIVAAFGLRLYRLAYQDIWWDEARNIAVAAKPLAQIATADELDIHPPAYFYLLHGWLRLAGADTAGEPIRLAFLARFLSLAFGVALVPLMYTMGRRVAGEWCGLGAAIGAAFLPFLLGEAQEIRMYTVTLAWLAAAGLALLIATRAGMKGRKPRPGRGWRACVLSTPSSLDPAPAAPRHSAIAWGLFAVCSALAFLSHYSAAFALIALWGWAVLWAIFAAPRDRRPLAARLKPLLLAGVLAIALAALITPVALRQVAGYRNPNLIVPSIAGYLAELVRVYGPGEHITGTAADRGGWLLAAWLALGCGITLVATARRKSALGPVLLAVLWAGLPLVIYYVAISDRSTFASRYISVALPGWLLLMGLALAGWRSLHKVVGGLAAVVLVAAMLPGLYGDLTDARFFREDTRGLIGWLKANADPENDIILVDQRYPFGLYYERWNSAPSGHAPAEPADLAPAQYVVGDPYTLPQRLAELTQGRRRVFYVNWFESDTDPRRIVPFLLTKFGSQLAEQGFRGYGVTSYAVDPAGQYELAPRLGGPQASFGGQVTLSGAAHGGHAAGATSTIAEANATHAPADKPVWAVAQWQRSPGAARPLKSTVVLADAEGRVVGQDDRLLLNDRNVSPPHWDDGEQPLAVFSITADPATPPGVYTLKLAVYDPATLEQLPAQGEAGSGSFVTLGQVELTAPTASPESATLPLDARADFAWRGLRLLGRGPLPAEISPGDRLAVDLFWQAEESDLPALAAELSLTDVTSNEERVKSQLSRIGGDYVTSQWAAGTVIRDRQAWQFHPDLPAGTYRLALRLADDGEQSAPVDLGEVRVAGRSHSFEPPASMGQASGATFGDFARLLGYDVRSEQGADGKPALEVTLYWQAEKASDIPYTASVQLLDSEGRLASQRDQQPGGGAFPTTGWVAREVLTDTYRLDVPDALAGQPPNVIVKLYDPATGRVLPVTAADGSALGDFLPLTQAGAP
jgi:mannosyltransferase